MSNGGGMATVLFWVMALVGCAVLAPCLILPPLFDYHATLEINRQADRRNAAMRDRLAVVTNQIATIERDPAYIERLAREEFGLTPSGVTPIRVESADAVAADSGLSTDEEAADLADSKLPEVSEMAQRLVREYPLARTFVMPETRPYALLFGVGMLLAAVLLLGSPPRRTAQPPTDSRG